MVVLEQKVKLSSKTRNKQLDNFVSLAQLIFNMIFGQERMMLGILWLILTREIFCSVSGLSNRYVEVEFMIQNKTLNLRLCATESDSEHCGSITGIDLNQNPVVTCNRTNESENSTLSTCISNNYLNKSNVSCYLLSYAVICNNERSKFFQTWKDHKYNCSSCSTNEVTAAATNNSTTMMTTDNHHNIINCSQTSTAVLATLIVILVIMLIMVTTALVYTCLTVRKLQEKTESQYINK